MTALTTPDAKKAMRENLTFLREYARRVVVEGNDSLTPLEDVKDALIQEVWSAGKSFRLTERDLVVLLYQGLLLESC